MMTDTILAWHFVGDTLRDGRPVSPDNMPLHQDGPIVLCKNGLHGSERLIDALYHAPGLILCRTEHSGTIVRGDDKLASSVRTILWRLDAMEVLRAFARRCALDVAHLWDMPDIVRRYLETGDEAIRDEAYATAHAAAAYAARAAAYAAAAADAVAYAAAACAVARAAAYAVAAADAAADAAAHAAYAAEGAAADAAADAARAAARDRQNTLLTSMVEAEYIKQKEN